MAIFSEGLKKAQQAFHSLVDQITASGLAPSIDPQTIADLGKFLGLAESFSERSQAAILALELFGKKGLLDPEQSSNLQDLRRILGGTGEEDAEEKKEAED